ncbi:MAG TPA: O-antigen ligase family protein [Terriglobia bacterium]|nr:O-antigen ligase family protein [Terriglobia bacterium]
MASSSAASRVRPIRTEAAAAGSGVAPILFTVARGVLLATLLAAPLAYGAVEAWAWAGIACLVLLTLLLWTAGSVARRVLKVAWSPLYVLAALLLSWGCIQYWTRWTLVPPATRESLLKLATDVILLFIATQLLADDFRPSLARWGFAVAVYAFALSLFAILQYSSSNGRIYWTTQSAGWVFGPYVNHNHYAGLMEMLIPVAAGHLLSRPERDPARPFLGFALLVPIASLLLSGSRGGLIALFAELLIFGSVLVVYGWQHNHQRYVAVLALAVTAAVATFFWLDFGKVSQRLATVFATPRSAEATMGARITMSRDALHIVRDYPWKGIGVGSFEDVYPRYQSFAADLNVVHAHDDYVEALAETGVVGGILMLAGLLIFLRRAFSQLRERLADESGWIQFGAAVGCCGLLVHSFADFNLHIPANAAWFCVCAVAAASGVAARRKTPRDGMGPTSASAGPPDQA